MKTIQLFFKLRAEYLSFKFRLKSQFEKLKIELHIYYAAKIKELNEE